MSKVVSLECSCGTVKGTLKVVPGAFFHVHCLCCDCQSYASHLNSQEKVLDKHGGTEVVQTYPVFMQISSGQDKIACLQLKEKGIYRWYASCCDTPVGNTMASAKAPFVGIPIAFMKFASEEEKMQVLGPVTLKAFGKYAIGEMPTDAHPKFPVSYMSKMLAFMIKGLFKKRNQPSPFFNGTEPVAKVKVVA